MLTASLPRSDVGASGLGQSSEYRTFGNPQHSVPGHYGDTAVQKSQSKICTVVRSKLDTTEEREIDAQWATVCRSIPVKHISTRGELCADTVMAWRNERRAPRLSKAIRAARRVPLLQAALLELLGFEHPAKDRLVASLLSHLAAIAGGKDEVSAARARRALIEFSDNTAMPLDGGFFP